MSDKSVLKGKEWAQYLIDNGMKSKSQMDVYAFTHNYTPCYKIGEYYFCFKIIRGYKNPASLKRLV